MSQEANRESETEHVQGVNDHQHKLDQEKRVSRGSKMKNDESIKLVKISERIKRNQIKKRSRDKAFLFVFFLNIGNRVWKRRKKLKGRQVHRTSCHHSRRWSSSLRPTRKHPGWIWSGIPPSQPRQNRRHLKIILRLKKSGGVSGQSNPLFCFFFLVFFFLF